ncbi:hypothetical protein [Amycolatopsis sp. GA6-003]|uniref:hypothetical protein n=1 Tax=Amycolatopsis sp. GA6-003 TaxID=2652444 RepID=UPI0039171FCF
MAEAALTRGRTLLVVLRAVVTVHAIAILGQPVFAGRYLIGDYDMLAMHELGANIVSTVALIQLVPAALYWWRGGVQWPFWASLLLAGGETAQYFAGQAGALDLHIPLGVALVAIALGTLFGIWRTGARR